jgi:hypothetical protein
MSNGEFKLEGVWRLRKAMRDERRLALAAVLESQRQLAAESARVAGELEAFQTRRRQATVPGVLRLQPLQGDLRIEESLRADRQRYLEQAEALDAMLRQRQDELRESEVEWKAVDWLRQKRS